MFGRTVYGLVVVLYMWYDATGTPGWIDFRYKSGDTELFYYLYGAHSMQYNVMGNNEMVTGTQLNVGLRF